jgi:hypothetical protein
MMLRAAGVQSFGIARGLHAGLHVLQLGDALADVFEVLCLHLLKAWLPLLALTACVRALSIGCRGLVGLGERETGCEKRSDNEGDLHGLLLCKVVEIE